MEGRGEGALDADVDAETGTDTPFADGKVMDD